MRGFHLQVCSRIKYTILRFGITLHKTALTAVDNALKNKSVKPITINYSYEQNYSNKRPNAFGEGCTE